MTIATSSTNRLAAAGIFCLLMCGCQAEMLNPTTLWFDEDLTAGVPDRVLPVWTDTVLHQPGTPAVRGFGGRLYFYKEGETDPITVDGSVTVYVFDGENFDPNSAAPLKKYIVTADQLASHHSTTSLGNSYSIWIPWDRVGGPTKSLSLVARFDGRNGGTVLGQPSSSLLPGVAANQYAAAPVRQASHMAPAPLDESVTGASSAMRSQTIALSRNFQRRLMAKDSPSTTTPTAEPAIGANPPRALPAPSPFNVAPANLRSAPAAAKAASPEPSPRYSPERFQGRARPRVGPSHVPVRRSPHPGGWLSGLPPTPRNGMRARTARTLPVPPPADAPQP